MTARRHRAFKLSIALVEHKPGVYGHDQLLAWRHKRFAAGARWVTIAAPPEVTK